MLSTIIKKLGENNKILKNFNVNIFLDDELFKNNKYIMSKLNENYCYNKIVRYLRANKINIIGINYLNSKCSEPIQFANILAYLTYKIFNNSKIVKLFSNTIDLYIDGLYIFLKF